MKNQQSHSLKKNVLIACSISIIALGFFAAILGCVMYNHGMIQKYQDYLTGMITYCANEIDGDDLEECIAKKRKSPVFEQEKKLLDKIKESHKAEYIYIVKPINTEATDNIIDVMAGETEYEKEISGDSEVQLGETTGDAYTSEVAAKYLAGMSNIPGQLSFFKNKTEFGYDYTGLTPIYNKKGEAVAVLAADVPINDIKMTLFRFILIVILGIVILSALFLTGMYRWMNQNIVTPINRIQESSLNFVKSSHGQTDPDMIFFEDPEVHTGNELEVLSDSIMTMASDLKTFMKNLIKETKERERIGAELSVATDIQADMLPSIFPMFTDRKEFEVFASMNPAKEVGGDFFDFFFVDDTHLTLVMADVSGKGVPAALFMVIAKTLIKNQALMGQSPSEVLENVNDQLCQGNSSEFFVTVWMAILDLSTGKGMAVNAGHEHPVICRKDGRYELVVYRHSPAVATMEGIPFRQHEFELQPGDSLFVYTDGVPEATNADNELFGTDRMLEALNRARGKDQKEVLTSVNSAVDEFVGQAMQFDDLTMLGFLYKGSI